MAETTASQFDFLRSRYPQAAKDAARAELHYAESHDLKSAGTAIRCSLEGFLTRLHERESKGHGEPGASSLQWLIDNVYAPRQGYREMHAIRIWGNDCAHPGQAPSTEEVAEYLTALHRILRHQVPEDEQPPPYRVPTRQSAPRDAHRTSQLEAKNARLIEERRSLEEEGALAQAKLEETAKQLDEANTAAQRLLEQKEVDQLEFKRLSSENSEQRRHQQELEAQMKSLELKLSIGRAAKSELDAELTQVTRELEALFQVHEWANTFPDENWSEAPSFIENRLMTGQPPFQEWHITPALIGEGGFGRVYRCFPSNDGVPVAVKIPWGTSARLRPVWAGECASARRVAAMFAEDKSLSVPRPLQIAPEGVDAFITYELVEGKELGALLGVNRSREPRWRLSTLQSLFIVDRLAATVDQLLQAGVRHTDLSPRNVILRAPHDPILIDYAPCLPGDTRPPEWDDRNPQECEIEVVRSGQIYLLASLLLRLLGIDRLPAAHALISSDVLDLQLVAVTGEDDWEPELASSISKRLESLEIGPREELRDLLLDLVDPDPEVRAGMNFDAVRRVLRRAYDPDQQISAIFAPA